RLERRGDLGIVALHRGRSDHDRRVAKIGCVVPDRDLDPATAQPFDRGALGDVRALYRVAEVVHDLGDARHADAADADEVDRADVGAAAFHGRPPVTAPIDKLRASGSGRSSAELMESTSSPARAEPVEARAAPPANAVPAEAVPSLATRITSWIGEPPKLSTRSARSLAAFGRPQFHAAWAALASVSGCCASAWICLASSLAVKLCWRMARAP